MLAAATYYCAVQLIPTWGGLVKSAFDLYLPELAEKLGYRLPGTVEERGQFWEDVNAMFLYVTPIPDRWERLQSSTVRPWWHAAATTPAEETTADAGTAADAESNEGRNGGADVRGG